MDKKEAAYLLQRIDCNCNECGFMKRDLAKLNYWRQKDLVYQQEAFTALRERTRKNAVEWDTKGDHEKAQVLWKEYENMKFQYQSRPAEIHYGYCMKFAKDVSFIPGQCQIDTQHCFIHRKDYVHTE